LVIKQKHECSAQIAQSPAEAESRIEWISIMKEDGFSGVASQDYKYLLGLFGSWTITKSNLHPSASVVKYRFPEKS
jgi:hypothetical protein